MCFEVAKIFEEFARKGQILAGNSWLLFLLLLLLVFVFPVTERKTN